MKGDIEQNTLCRSWLRGLLLHIWCFNRTVIVRDTDEELAEQGINRCLEVLALKHRHTPVFRFEEKSNPHWKKLFKEAGEPRL